MSEPKLLRKIDLRVVPVLSVLYLLAFLDRTNVANAAIYGLQEDLGLVGTQYSTALTIFFVPYVVFEVPSNLVLKKLKPHVWLSFCMFMFGLITLCQGLVQNWAGFMTTRFLLGVFEAGMYLQAQTREARTGADSHTRHVPRMLLPDIHVVPTPRSTKAVHFLLRLNVSCRRIRRSPGQRHR